jgi:hypothetical protein
MENHLKCIRDHRPLLTPPGCPATCASIDDVKQLGIEVVEPEPHQRHVSLGGDPLAVGCFNPLVLLCAEEVAEAFANGRRSGSRPARAS